jgi:hypothetical protein
MLNFENISVCVGAQYFFLKKVEEIFGEVKKRHYLCNRYPENNLFTLEN